MPPIPFIDTGVYCFLNTVNGKRYVGSSAKSIKGRRRNHLALLRNGKHHSIHFQRSWNLYGEQRFEFVVLERCLPARCVEREQWWINHYKSSHPLEGYNRNPVAKSSLGVKRSAETRAKISAATKGRKLTEDRKREIAARMQGNKIMYGKTLPADVRAKLSQANRGRKVSDIVKSKVSAAMLGNTNSKGRVLTDEHKRRIGEANKGRITPDETRLKLAQASKGRKVSKETRAKLSTAMTGRKPSDETRARMVEAWKRRKERGRIAVRGNV